LPEKIDANIEHLEVGDSITIGDLDIPEGVEPNLAADVLVAIVNESRVTKSADEEAEEETGEAPAEEAEAE
ncbi:MAG TPA: 50S ribosomal protein L25, partial [Verrucomicrobiales bacterium]|nr:50S ribosomal protein L25 [Verrucomicrobiales bacterium]